MDRIIAIHAKGGQRDIGSGDGDEAVFAKGVFQQFAIIALEGIGDAASGEAEVESACVGIDAAIGKKHVRGRQRFRHIELVGAVLIDGKAFFGNGEGESFDLLGFGLVKGLRGDKFGVEALEVFVNRLDGEGVILVRVDVEEGIGSVLGEGEILFGGFVIGIG